MKSFPPVPGYTLNYGKRNDDATEELNVLSVKEKLYNIAPHGKAIEIGSQTRASPK